MDQKQDIAIHKETFGYLPHGDQVSLYRLTNNSGMSVDIIDYGAIIVRMLVPDKQGRPGDIVLGFDHLEPYLGPHPKFGALIGRYANRIAYGRVTIDGESYQLPVNLPPHHIHGGEQGFDRHLYHAETKTHDHAAELILSRTSPHMEQVFPGNLSLRISYMLTDDNELRITYHARTDRTTILNLTNHSYFNLKGAGNGDILDHNLMISSDRYVGTDQALIPTGELLPVVHTPLDFRAAKRIGQEISSDHESMRYQGGYDHCYVLKGNGELNLAAEAKDQTTGRVMKVYTTEPAVQLYTANFGDHSIEGKDSAVYKAHSGFCLETQHFPDSPNHPEFPSTELQPGETFESVTVYAFSVED